MRVARRPIVMIYTCVFSSICGPPCVDLYFMCVWTAKGLPIVPSAFDLPYLGVMLIDRE